LPDAHPRFVGAELYFDDLEAARVFYERTLGLKPSEEAPGHYVQFGAGEGFVCLERKGSESYPSPDKAVLSFEVGDLHAAIEAIGQDRIVGGDLEGAEARRPWAVLHDPEGHNILLLQARADAIHD
jgi:predicted enzyme related to lactoylglutathione lyase